MSLIAVDVSDNNASNYQTAIDGADIAIVKISEGVSYINPLANEQIDYAKSKNKLIGVYHFVVGTIDTTAQADYFYNNAKSYLDTPGIVPIFDFERPQGYPSITGDEPKVFLDRISALTGKDGILYIGHQDVVSGAYNWSDVAGKYPFWVAGYPSNDGSPYTQALQSWADANYFSNQSYNGINVAMWQFDSVPWDRSVFYGDHSAWLAIGGQGNEDNNDEALVSVKGEDDMLLFKSDINTEFGDAANVFLQTGTAVIKVDSPVTMGNLQKQGVPFTVMTKRNTESLIKKFGLV